MSLRSRITKALEANPRASSYEIARVVGSTSEYVRTVKQRILIAKNRPPGPRGAQRKFVKVPIADFRHLIREGEKPEETLKRLFSRQNPG